MDDEIIPVDPAADETGLRRNILLLELEKARNTVDADFASSTVINMSKDFSEIYFKGNQTVAFKNLSRATENLRQSLPEKKCDDLLFLLNSNVPHLKNFFLQFHNYAIF